jgi:hypothetical protein
LERHLRFFALVIFGMLFLIIKDSSVESHNNNENRYAIVPDAVAETFHNSQSLLYLARFVDEMHKARRKWTGPSAKPFILGVKKQAAGTILFVGIDILVRNSINKKMRLAGMKIDARMRYDEAESSIEISQVDLMRFLIALNSTIIDEDDDVVNENE